MKQKLAVCLALVLLASMSEAARGIWPTFQYDNQRTGLSPYAGPALPDSSWVFKTEGRVWSSPAVGVDGTIYFGSEDKNLYALNPHGTLKWRFTTRGSVLSAPALGDDGRIYVGASDSSVYCIEDSVTYAKLRWSFRTRTGVSTPVLVDDDGAVYARTGTLYAIDPQGNQKWTYGTGLSVSVGGGSALSTDGGTVYTEACDPVPFEYALTALSTNGTVKWKRTIGQAPFDFSMSTPTVGADNTVYFPTFSLKTFYALNSTGTVKWRAQVSAEVMFCSAALGPDGTSYIGTYVNPRLTAIGPDGGVKWEFPAGSGRGWSSPIVDAEGTIYFGTGKVFYALNPNGSKKWEYALEDSIFSSPALAGDGRILIGAGKKLYALLGASGVAESPGRDFTSPISACPNPFSGTTRISFALDNPRPVSLSIRDITGRLLRVLVAEKRQSGHCEASWDGTDGSGARLGSGVYLLEVSAGGLRATQKLVVRR